MPITFGGLSSGLPPNIVDQLMEAEKIPLKNIEKQKGKQENRLKLVEELETKLTAITGTIGELASTKGFTDMKLNSGDPNVLQGAVDPNAATTGDWNIEVESLAQKAAALSNGFPDKDKSQVGVGYIRFETPDGEKEIYINGSNNTLEKVAETITHSGLGVKASVINDRSNPDAPYRLMISGESVGDDHKISYPTLYFLDGDQDFYFADQREAKNGKIKVDGFEFEVGDNTVKDVIPGVTLQLKQANPGRSVNINVKEDREVVAGKIKGFVDSMNAVLGFIQKQNALTKETDTSSTLGGDSLLSTVESRMRALIQNPQYGAGTTVNRLSQLGIEFTRAGTLQYDDKKFNNTLAANPEAVQKFLAGDGWKTGFVPQLKMTIENLVSSAYGPVSIRKRALQDRISQMDRQLDDKQRQLAQKEQMLRNKFARLEETMSRLKGQGSAIGAIGAAGGFGGGGGGGGAGPQAQG